MKIFPRIQYAAVFAAAAALLCGPFGLAQTSTTTPATAQTGQQVQLEGQIEIVHQDFANGKGKFVYTLTQADGTRTPLHFAKGAPTHLLTGDHVRVTGQMSSGGVLLYSGANANKTGGGSGGGGGGSSCTADSGTTCSTTSSIPVPNTFGAQSVLVILVNFQDDAIQPFTTADVQNAVFNTANSFFAENSYQQTSLTGQVVGWYTVPDSVTSCNLSQIATDGQNAAAAAGVNLASYTRYLYFFPYNAVCGFSGASQVGGSPSLTWINGTLAPYVVQHEIGHAFGLWHAHLFDCGTSATICSSPNIVEYGDPMDTMGTAQTASADYNSFQKERLGWLNYGASPSIQTVTSSGTYTIYPYELASSGPNALKVLKSTDPTTGAKTWYYLEARQATGFDSFLSNSFYYTQNETTGVLFHLGTDGDGNSSDLLDMTPSTPTVSGWFDMSLATGQSFQDSAAGVTFASTTASSSGATVQITLNGSSCTATNPTVSASPTASQYVTSGTPVSFTITVKDNDAASCSAATFNLASTLPSGWIGSWSASSLSLSPGKSASATLTVTSPVGTADGSYNVGVSATNSSAGSTGSAAASYVINTAPLSTSVATNQSTYLPGQTVTVIVTMLYGASPDVGASATVTVTSPGGKTISTSGTTGSNGVATLTFKLSNHATIGTYQVQVGGTTTRTLAAALLGPSTSFTVQ